MRTPTSRLRKRAPGLWEKEPVLAGYDERGIVIFPGCYTL